MMPGYLKVVRCEEGVGQLSAACGIDFDFYSLFDCGSANA
jgi:hypothetical protein